MGRYITMIVCMAVLALATACVPPKEKEKAEVPAETFITRDDALAGLPCFKCHSIGRFNAREKGRFPHSMHRDTGYHCNQCHIIRGHHAVEFITSGCRECHGLKTFTLASSALPVKFNHEFHAAFGCRECHPGVFLMKKGAAVMTMDAMYKGRFCGACHDGKKAFPSSECTRCHEMKKFDRELAYKVEGVGNVVFSHRFHTGLFKCDTCHPSLFAMKKTEDRMSMADMNKEKFCGGCHNGNVATSVSECGKCHKP